MSDLTDNILTNAAAPRRIRGDEGEVEEHSLPDQIALDKHVRSSNAMKRGNLGIKFIKLSPPGTV